MFSGKIAVMSGGSSAGGDDVWQRRLVLAETNGRRVNEAIERGRRDRGSAAFVCECGRIGCSSTVSLTLDAYEHVRTAFDRFVLATGHESPDIEDVVERHGDYLIVRKRGPGSEIAEQTDPRG